MENKDKNKRQVRPLGVFALIMGIIYSLPFFAMFIFRTNVAITLGLACIPISAISFAAAKTNFWKIPATNIRISYLGHRCFRLDCDEQTVILDPYAPGSVPGLKPVSGKADLVLCSDGDGFASSGIKMRNSKKPLPFEVSEFEAENGMSRIFMLDNGDHRVVHLGCLSCELTEEQIETFKGADVLMVPVGGKYTIGEDYAAKITVEICPEYVLPMSFLAANYGLSDIGYGAGFAPAVKEYWFSEEGNEDKRCPVTIRLAARNGREKGLSSVEVRNRDDAGR